jgi:hypothetical protein
MWSAASTVLGGIFGISKLHSDHRMETPPTMNITDKGQLASALADLKLCSRDLTAAYKDATDAETQLAGARARRARAVQLAEKIADAIAHAQRLAFFVEGDLYAADDEEGEH